MSEDAFVYLLACADSSLYCGWTTDLERRFASHSAGRGGAYTRARLPVRVAAAWRCASRTQARSLEARVKLLPRATKLALVDGRARIEETCAGGADGDAAERLSV
ncbi:MAG TPA: GIY-YIG nuclease family protein [Solirubrobacteraceae bacterium]|nr:GIY-YIG nuclease family protein [Solirubrobacteraceae bacterium]